MEVQRALAEATDGELRAGSAFELETYEASAFDAGAWASYDRRTHEILCVCETLNGEGGRRSVPLAFASLHRSRGHLARLAGRPALRSLAGRLAGRLARGLASRLASGLAGRLARALADRLARLASLGRLLRGLLYFLSHLRFLVFTSVERWVGWELFDSPMVFLKQSGEQMVSASVRANFSAPSIFCCAHVVRNRCAP